MTKLTLDEAIKHCLEVAKRQEISADDKEMYSEMLGEDYKGFEEGCKECAADHRRLAEWLTELKEAKRLLKAAVEDMSEENFCAKVCKRDNFACRVSDTCDFKWRYADEALALIGEDGEQK